MKYKKIICLILIVLIIAVNCISVSMLVNKRDVNELNVFDSPDSIILYFERSYNTVKPDYSGYDDILKLINNNYNNLKTLKNINWIKPVGDNQLWLEFKYNSPKAFELNIDNKKQTVESERVFFVITGEQKGTTCVVTADGQFTLEGIEFTSEQVELMAQYIINAPRIE